MILVDVDESVADSHDLLSGCSTEGDLKLSSLKRDSCRID